MFRTERRRNEKTGATYPWLVRSTAMVNHFYIYCLDDNFGPFFLKFSTYFPYNAKLCLNGHEYANRQLARLKAGIYPVTLSLIPSFGACTRSCLVPRYRSVVWTDAWPRSNWICSSSPPAARHIFAQLRLRGHGAQFREHLRPSRMAGGVQNHSSVHSRAGGSTARALTPLGSRRTTVS